MILNLVVVVHLRFSGLGIIGQIAGKQMIHCLWYYQRGVPELKKDKNKKFYHHVSIICIFGIINLELLKQTQIGPTASSGLVSRIEEFARPLVS